MSHNPIPFTCKRPGCDNRVVRDRGNTAVVSYVEPWFVHLATVCPCGSVGRAFLGMTPMGFIMSLAAEFGLRIEPLPDGDTIADQLLVLLWLAT